MVGCSEKGKQAANTGLNDKNSFEVELSCFKFRLPDRYIRSGYSEYMGDEGNYLMAIEDKNEYCTPEKYIKFWGN